MFPVVFVLLLFVTSEVVLGQRDFCNPSPCGENADCALADGRPTCGCKPTYRGDPLKGCKRECEKDADCSSDKGCINYRCRDPCLNGCGDYATCQVQNHQPICQCPKQYGGDAYVKCIPECQSKQECPSHLSCIDYHCGNPCNERPPCGRNADCEVRDHTVICTCKPGFIGEPLSTGCRRRS